MRTDSPEAYESKVVKTTDAVQRTVVDKEEKKVIHLFRFEPESWEEGAAYHEAGASAYELYVICSEAGVIEEVNHRGEQCPCGVRSIAPHGAPASIFPQGAMFDLDWDDIATSAQKKMLRALARMVGARAKG